MDNPNAKNVKSQKCDTCIHLGVCKIYANRLKLEDQIKDLEKHMENQSFSINVSCKYYLCIADPKNK